MNKFLKYAIWAVVVIGIIYAIWYFFFRKTGFPGLIAPANGAVTGLPVTEDVSTL